MRAAIRFCVTLLCLSQCLQAEAVEWPDAGGEVLPPYWTIQTPRAEAARHHGPSLPSASVRPLPATTYSYGWFGAQRRVHWSRHFGYYRRYTEWSAR